ncbi:SufS family cysteine desulfurase [Candidatus Gottesmanbacteria bacterium]|nr:SufS family cysteine desulfurase [Candidatus Gottesmanbacteria bacterium]
MKDVRSDFPQLKRKINGKRLVYLDSSATSLKPRQVISKEVEYYEMYCANVFRGIYRTSEEATEEFKNARTKVAAFIGANESAEVIFTRNTSESINLVASAMKKTDEVVTTIMEHHSNFVPWQQLAKLKVWKLGKDGRLDLRELDRLVTPKTKLLAITAVSNVLGTISPIRHICHIVKKINPHCLVLVDAAQAVPHLKMNVEDWEADFVAFSSHKMLGPTGVGVLWGKREVLEQLSPYQYGGDMIKEVHIEKTVFADLPHKFEAGSPHIAGVIGLGAAVDYLNALGMDTVRRHEEEITGYALKRLLNVRDVTVYGPKEAKDRGGVIAFTMKGTHAHDIAQLLDEDNVCIRAGHHCAMPLHEYLHIPATARASFYVYTTRSDVDALIVGLEKVRKLFA